MFFLLGSDRKNRTASKQNQQTLEQAREMFLSGKFPVVTTQQIEGRRIVKVLGLVCCRGFDSDETFFRMASRAMTKGAQAIIGYSENVAFHPDGSKYFSCYGVEGKCDLVCHTEAEKELLSDYPLCPLPPMRFS